MRRIRKGILLLPVELLIVMTMIFMTSCSNNSDGSYRQTDNMEKGSEEYRITQEEVTEEDYSTVYPFYGMREEALRNCALGEPASVEPCRDFWKLVPRARYQTYEFGIFGKPLSGKFTVRYRWHYSHRFDDYIDLPAENGYVASGWFVDSDGIRYTLDSDGVKVHEYPSEQNNVKPSKEASKRESDDTEVDPDDHDIEAYYEDNKDIYDSYDDAWDGFEDDEDAWDDY